MELSRFVSATALNQCLAEHITRILNEAVKQRGRAYWVVSGGKTPVDLFKQLAQMHLPWDHITLCLADERCVPVDNSARNEALVKTYLLQGQLDKVEFISLYHEQQVDSLEQVKSSIAALPTFDVVVLGMGEDGHTASLFPCSAEIASSLDDNAAAVLLMNPQTAPFQRVSLSKSRLLDSRTVFLHLVGEKKLVVLEQALDNKDVLAMPISVFLNHPTLNMQVMYAPE